MKRTPFTPEDDETIRNLYPTHTAEQIGKVIGRTISAIRNRCWRLGILGKCRPWTDAELAILCDHYSDHDAPVNQKKLCEILGRDKATISSKAKLLGLSSRTRKKSDEVKATMGERVKRRWAEGRHPRGMLGKRHTEQTKRIVSQTSADRWADPNSKFHTTEHKAKRKAALRGGVRARISDAKTIYSRCKKGCRVDIGATWFRSSWEANYARHLNRLMEHAEVFFWEYEVRKFEFPDDGNRPIFYTPDFRVWYHDGSHEWHEVKGWFTEKAKDAVARFGECYPEERLAIIGQDWFQKAERRGGLAQTIPNWEWTQKRKWHESL